MIFPFGRRFFRVLIFRERFDLKIDITIGIGYPFLLYLVLFYPTSLISTLTTLILVPLIMIPWAVGFGPLIVRRIKK